MPITKSVKKRVRQANTRYERNKALSIALKKTIKEFFPSSRVAERLQNRYHVWKEIVNVNKSIAKKLINEKYE
mgnify:CR=1 FL=1